MTTWPSIPVFSSWSEIVKIFKTDVLILVGITYLIRFNFDKLFLPLGYVLQIMSLINNEILKNHY